MSNLQFMKTDRCSFFACTFVGQVGVGIKRKEKKPKGRGVGRVGEWSVHVCWEEGRKEEKQRAEEWAGWVSGVCMFVGRRGGRRKSKGQRSGQGG